MVFSQGQHNLTESTECEALIECARALAVQHLTESKHLEQFIRATSCTDHRSVGVDDDHVFSPLGKALALLRARKSFR